MGLCVTISLGPVKVAFKVMSDRIGLSPTSQHQSLQIIERRSSFQSDGTLHFYCGYCEFILLDGLCVATQSYGIFDLGFSECLSYGFSDIY